MEGLQTASALVQAFCALVMAYAVFRRPPTGGAPATNLRSKPAPVKGRTVKGEQ